MENVYIDRIVLIKKNKKQKRQGNGFVLIVLPQFDRSNFSVVFLTSPGSK